MPIWLLFGLLQLMQSGRADDGDNICARNATFGRAVVNAVNLSLPGLANAAHYAQPPRRNLGAACRAISDYYRLGNSTAGLRRPAPPPSTRLVNDPQVNAMVFNDTFHGFPSPKTPVRIPRNTDGEHRRRPRVDVHGA